MKTIEKYFWITSGEDGTNIEVLSSAADVENRIVRDYLHDGIDPPPFLNAHPQSDKGCWMGVPENAVLLIKGSIVIPQEKKTVVSFSVE